MTTIYKFSDLYTCNKNTINRIHIIDEKLTKDDLLYIFTFTNLQSLILIKNDIDEIPKEISNLKNLTNLAINYNNIVNLPTSINTLKLEYLNISQNNIELFQDELLELTQLTELNINNNRISQIPQEIYKLHNLRELNIGNVENDGTYVSYFINEKNKKLNISDFKYLSNENNVLDLPDEIAYLQFLVNCYIPELKTNYKIFDNNMIIFANQEIMDFIIPEKIINLTILCSAFKNEHINNLLNALPISVERLSLSKVNIDVPIENLPMGLKQLYFYTAPYCGLFKPYSHWSRHVTKEDILKFKIPFGCSIFLNDEQI